MAGRSGRIIHDGSNSEDEFEFGISIDENESESRDNDYNDSDNSSDSEILLRKRRRIPNIIYSEDEHEEHDTADESIEWKDVTEGDDFPPRIPFNTFSKVPGPQVLTHIKKPLDFFKLFFTDELIDNIIKITNNHAKQKIKAMEPLSKESIWKTWKDVERKEFLAFLGVIFNMGTMPLANMKEYWSTRKNSTIPFYRNTFSRNRFLQIFWMLYLNDNFPGNQNMRTRIQKVSNFLEYIDSKFLQYFVPYKDISVDESVVKFKGRVGFITYNPKKPTKWGIRIYVLAD